MEPPREDMDIEDESIQVQLAHIFAALGDMVPVYDPSHSDLVDNSNMNHAAIESNKRHLQGKNDEVIRKIDTTTSQVIAKDLETLKGHSKEVGKLLNQLMQFAEGDGDYRQGDRTSPVEENKRKMEELTSICSHVTLDRPFVKLSLFSDIINLQTMPIEKLSQVMTAPKGNNKIWKMLPTMINTTMDILIKLYCSWMLYASLIDLKKIVSNKEDDCLLDLSDPYVLTTIDHINEVIAKRKDSSLITLLPSETIPPKKIGNKSIMKDNLSKMVIPCLFKIESVISNVGGGEGCKLYKPASSTV